MSYGCIGRDRPCPYKPMSSLPEMSPTLEPLDSFDTSDPKTQVSLTLFLCVKTERVTYVVFWDLLYVLRR